MVYQHVLPVMVFFSKIKRWLLIGGGDSAMEEANFLTKFASEVILIHRRSEFRASKIMVERTLSNPKVNVIYNAIVKDIFGSKDEGVDSIEINDVINGSKNYKMRWCFYGYRAYTQYSIIQRLY